MNKTPDTRLTRRRVFAGAGTAGALAAAAAVLPLQQSSAVAADGASAAAPPDADGRYQLTQHVLRYYQTVKI